MKILENITEDGCCYYLVAEVEPNQKGKPKLRIRAKLQDPDALPYWEIPTMIEVDARYVGENQKALAQVLVGYMTAKYYGDIAVGVMDSYDEYYGTIAIELFDKRPRKYPVGNLAIFEFPQEEGLRASDEIFAKDFNLTALIDDIIRVCDRMIRNSQRKADYFVFYGRNNAQTVDAMWKKKLEDEGCQVIKCDRGQSFIAVRKINQSK